MSEPFLEEQLRRIKRMTERIVEARNRQDELSRQIERQQEIRWQQAHAGFDSAVLRNTVRPDSQYQYERKDEHERAAHQPPRRRSTVVRRHR
jgi:hypothetical protein